LNRTADVSFGIAGVVVAEAQNFFPYHWCLLVAVLFSCYYCTDFVLLLESFFEPKRIDVVVDHSHRLIVEFVPRRNRRGQGSCSSYGSLKSIKQELGSSANKTKNDEVTQRKGHPLHS